ncbi:hypothetical protein BUALT_Bualt07G0115400 [Buddleja alternifolia]|uniref:Transposase n=1 Tax=Buddleja alternifolia TaxID=168488 RepID=A0AAV6XGI4_9LAMI|nr:hypothetical protein BUALT_Bualt07G0115400 [Buddleja alternifolia]
MLVDEQVAMTVHILAHHQKHRTINGNFERSGETISRHFRKVINVIIRLQGKLLKTPEAVPDNSTDERWKWFKGCLGALDGTHIRVHVSAEDMPRYRTRKSEIATNVLGVCSQDMQFIYVLPGWEGSTADGRVLRDAISRRNGLVVPRGSYYLVDARYTNGEGFLAPFRDTRDRRKNKRKWKYEEDAKLVDALLDMVNLGTYKADNGFIPGYLNYVEEKMHVSLPNSGLKAKPHIESRIKTLKKDFNIVYDMLNSPNTSGFGMDPIRKYITADKAVWDEHLQSHPAHSSWQNKSFPFYDDLLTIFGKDHSMGINAEGVHNQKKKKRSRSQDNLTIMTDSIKEAASVIGNEIAKAIGVDTEISEKRQKIDSEIRKITNLTISEIIKAVCHVARDHELTDVFFSMTDEGKEQLVGAILRGDV